MDKLGIVYFIRAGNSRFVKIGWTSNLKARLPKLQIAHPLRLKVLLTLPGNRGRESHLHDQFKADRAHGEWFRLSDDLRRFMRQQGGDAPHA